VRFNSPLSIFPVFILFVFFDLTSSAQQSRTPDTLPPPYATKSKMNFSKVVGWKNGAKPIAPEGFEVTEFAADLKNPRWMYVLSNGDVLVAESNSHYGLLKRIGAFFVGAHRSNTLRKSADRITLLRDKNSDGVPEERFVLLKKLNQPFGMVMLGDELYVANTNGILKYAYTVGNNSVKGQPVKITDLPAGKVNRHWPRNIIADKDGKKIFIAVGSGDDHGEKGMENEINRAAILRINSDGSGLEVFASGLRNPCGMAFAPGSDQLYTVVNERDMLGDNLVPDYLTSVKKDGFYGWPYAYFGNHADPRVPAPKPDLVEKTIVPDFELGAHTASLGLQFYTGKSFPSKYHNGAFIAQHGSWNRSVLSGYKVIYVPFENGKPKDIKEDFLTGFISDIDKDKVRGRPVGLAILPDGSLLVSDDRCNRIWRVAWKGK
jgi:glucose/arabinose dehydrogenase